MERYLFCCFLALAWIQGPPAAPAQTIELRTTEWGTIEPVWDEPGVYQLNVSQWPSDGILELPEMIGQITRGYSQSKGRTLAIDVERDPQTQRLRLHTESLPIGVKRHALRIETADTTQQSEDGRILLHPNDAKRTSDQLQLNDAAGQAWIGSWLNSDDEVSWTYKATRWGKYQVLLTYSTDSTDGSTIEVEIGDEHRKVEVKPTTTSHRFATIDLGTVFIKQEGPLDVTVRCLERKGATVMNLKSVVLVPACEGTLPTASTMDGIVTLHGRDSIVRGTTLRYEPADIKQTLGYWVRPTDRAQWWFTTHAPGTYDVEVWQGCGQGHGGSRVAVTVDGEPLEFTVEDTGHFQNFKPRTIGQITLASPGQHQLQIKPLQIANVAALDVRQVRLLPVAFESPRQLILPGERLQVAGRPGFVFMPPESLRRQPQPWVFYAPTLADVPDVHEKWMHEQFLAAGIAVAGIDIGEGYGSSLSHPVMTAFYRELVDRRGFSPRPCLLGRSRGGLWMSSWAAAHPDRVAGLAGIYPVFDLTSYPGIERAASAYDLQPEELADQLPSLNPIERVTRLAEAKIPVFLIHGDQDEVVPLEKNSAAFQARYEAAGAGELLTLEIATGQGHNYWEGFFRSPTLVDFVISKAR